MDAPPENTGNGLKPNITIYADNLLDRISSYFSAASYSNFLNRISNFNRGSSNATKRRRRKTCLPLPFPSSSSSTESSTVVCEASRIVGVLEDIMQCTFLNLHYIQKNLEYWQTKAQGSNAQKAYFMICQRGPNAFFNGSVQLISDCVGEGSGVQHTYCLASSYISERINFLSGLRYHLATFLAQIYMKVDKAGEELVKDPEKSLSSLLVDMNGLFLKLEASIGHFHAVRQQSSSVDESYSFPLIFEKLPEVNQEGSQWTDCEIRDAINLIYQNMDRLNTYLAAIVTIHRKPRRVTRYWIPYTCGIVGISICSLWLLRHSSLVGSSDIDNWVREAKESTVSFWNDHVEQPLIQIRDDLFYTFRKRQKGAMEPEEVQLTADSLHRMLQAFTEQTKGEKPPVNPTDQEMLEIVMMSLFNGSRPLPEALSMQLRYNGSASYVQRICLCCLPAHQLQVREGADASNSKSFSGELSRALLIQVQKLKLDIEEAMLELDQILRANEINFAILAALPAFFLSLFVIMLVRAWFKQDKKAEGRGRVARIQRRLLIVEVERKIMQLESCKDQGQEKDAQCMLGLALYYLDRLYYAVEGHARATGEWISLRQDIIDLAKPDFQTAHKLRITSRMERVYDCLLPLPKR